MSFGKLKTKQLRAAMEKSGMSSKGQTRDVMIWRLRQHAQKKYERTARGRLKRVHRKQMEALQAALRGRSNMSGAMILRLMCECKLTSVYDMPVVADKAKSSKKKNSHFPAALVYRDMVGDIVHDQHGLSVHGFANKFGTPTAKHCVSHECPAVGMTALVLQTKLQLYRAVCNTCFCVYSCVVCP